MEMNWDVEIVEESDADFPKEATNTDALVLRRVDTKMVFFA